MEKISRSVGAWAFFAAVFFNAFVDLGHKIIIQNTIFKLHDGPEQIIMTAIVNGLILLPFIMLMSPAGFISDAFSKVRVMRLAAWVAVGLTAAITLSYYAGLFWIAFGMTFLLAVQSAVYSPAKYGLIKQLFGKEKLSEANGVTAALSIGAILLGTLAFSILFEALLVDTKALSSTELIKVIAPVGWLLIASAMIELWATYRIPESDTVRLDSSFDFKKFISGRLFKEDLKPLFTSRPIWLSAVGLSIFWGVGQVLLAGFPAFFKGVTGSDNTVVVQGILACTGVGIALGSLVAGRCSKNYIETGLLPVGAAGIAVGLIVLPFLNGSLGFAVAMLGIGFAGGLFIVPLNALIQFHASKDDIGRTLAASNWLQNVTMLAFLVLSVSFAYLSLQSKALLHLLAIVAVVGCAYVLVQIPQSFVRFVFSMAFTRRYRVVVQGMKNVPESGGVLLLGNHVSWIDWAIIQIASPRPIRFVMLRSIYDNRAIKWLLDIFGCIPIDPGPRSRKSLDQVAEYLNKGEVVCLFPEGQITRNGHLAEFRKGFERACAGANDNVVVVPFYLRGLWGSQFSRSTSKSRPTGRSSLRREIIVAFGSPMPKDITADVLKRRVFDLSIASWDRYVETLPSLAHAWIASSKRVGRGVCIIDDALKQRLSGTRSLAATMMLARRIKRLPGQNIGILLPTSAPGMLINLAAILAGKTVVNINYTSSADAVAGAMRKAQIGHVISSKRFFDKLLRKGVDIEPVLDEVAVKIDVTDLMGDIAILEKLISFTVAGIVPAGLIQAFYCRNLDPGQNAAILFSSGSEGVPKGIQITHKNVLANVKQISEVLDMTDQDVIMANLPLFHAFGMTVNQFLPLLEGCPVVCQADPTDVLSSAQSIARHKATIMCGTSTFLRLYCRNRKVHPLMLDSLRIVVAGAEKLSGDVRESFALKFNKRIYEGYGATETTPVASVNVPNKLELQHFKVQQGEKAGSVGMPLPGTSCMIVDPQTWCELPTGESGMILIGGAQVMAGYLDDPEKTALAIKEINGTRWYVSGDKGYLDEDGYLFIVDRYSRFAKIGGEMVSLGAVESAINGAIADPDIEVIVTSIPDDKKGERLVALSERDVDSDEIKSALKESGMSALSIPGDWFVLDSLPKLGSGKTDFSRAKTLALELSR